MKKALLLTLLSCLSMPLFAQQSAPKDESGKPKKQTVLIFPAKLSFKLDRGGSASKSVTIQNTTTSKFQLELVFVDWIRDTLGEHAYADPGTVKQSCAPWVTFDKPFVELSPGQSTNITVTMKVPDTEEAVSEMKWTMLVLRTVSEKKAPTKIGKVGASVDQSVGLGVHIYQTPPNITNREIKMLSFSEIPGKNVYRVDCKNLGGVQLLTKFSLELSSNETGAKTALEPRMIPLFPKQERYVDFELPSNLPKGKYTAIALIDAGEDDIPIEAAQKEIIIK